LAHVIVHGLRGTALLAPAGRARELPRARLLLTRFLKRLPSESTGEPPTVAAAPLRSASVPRIHPSAVVDPKAVIGDDCEIGPFCIVGPDVVMGAGNKLESHVVITGHTTVGADNHFFPYAVIGSVPQDKKYRGEDTRLVIGDRNVIREAVTMHAGTLDGGGFTRVGHDNLVMVNCHVGHDCLVGNHCILGNNVMLAGHTVIEDRVNMSGGSATNSFATIGQFAYIAAMARIHHDVPPFMKVSDDDKVRDVNAVGLRRAGVGAEDIEQIEAAARQLFFAKKNKKPFAAVLAAYEADPATHPRVQQMVAFLRRRDTGRSGRYLESLRAKK
jgi:UDP-N-acetylglucosamine acyltransferase